MSWPTVALVLVGCAASGALLGAALPRVRAGWPLAAAVLAGFVAFLPGTCATAIAATPYGDPELLQGRTTCWFLYGPAVPELGSLGAGVTAGVLQFAGALLAVVAVVLVRRSRRARSRDEAR